MNWTIIHIFHQIGTSQREGRSTPVAILQLSQFRLVNQKWRLITSVKPKPNHINSYYDCQCDSSNEKCTSRNRSHIIRTFYKHHINELTRRVQDQSTLNQTFLTKFSAHFINYTRLSAFCQSQNNTDVIDQKKNWSRFIIDQSFGPICVDMCQISRTGGWSEWQLSRLPDLCPIQLVWYETKPWPMCWYLQEYHLGVDIYDVTVTC